MRRSLFLLSPLVPLSAARGSAEVLDSSAQGFTSQNAATIPAPPAEVCAKLVHGVNICWSAAHTYSGDVANPRIDATQGGCFCESLPTGGSVRHLEVVYADPGKTLRLTGGRGPLQATAATGTMTWELEEADSGTSISVTYAVGGYVPDGLDTWAEAVDRVVGEQLSRLARFVTAGYPEEPTQSPDPNDRSEV